jgi:hypothetical protein
MPSFTPIETTEFDSKTDDLAVDALARTLAGIPGPIPGFDIPGHVWRQLQEQTGIFQPSYIGRHWDRITARAREMREE